SSLVRPPATSAVFTLSLHDALPILMLPIWGGNLIPALIISSFGFGLMQRDGLAVVAAWSAIAVLCLAGLVIWLAWRWVSPYLLPDRKSTRLNSSHVKISYAVFCLKK